MNDPEPLLALQRLLGGKIYGPYNHGGRQYNAWRLVGYELYAHLRLFDAILPLGRKREQYRAWKAKYGYGGTWRRQSRSAPSDGAAERAAT
jgi:hypothetical protein